MRLIAFKLLKSRNGATPFGSYTILYIKNFLTPPKQTDYRGLFGPFRGGNKPPVLPGEENERSKNKNGELKANRKDL